MHIKLNFLTIFKTSKILLDVSKVLCHCCIVTKVLQHFSETGMSSWNILADLLISTDISTN